MSYSLSASGHFPDAATEEAFIGDVLAAFRKHASVDANAVSSLTLSTQNWGTFDASHVQATKRTRAQAIAEDGALATIEGEVSVGRTVGNPTGPRYDAEGRKLSPEDAVEAVADDLTPEQAEALPLEPTKEESVLKGSPPPEGWSQEDWDAIEDAERSEVLYGPADTGVPES